MFPHYFRKLGIPSLNMVIWSIVSFCVDIPHVHGDFWIITKLCLHKALIKNYHFTLLKFYRSHPPLMDTSWMDMKIVNAPLSCYIVKWRNRKVAITGLVQLSNLISSYNGNLKVAITGCSYNGKTPFVLEYIVYKRCYECMPALLNTPLAWGSAVRPISKERTWLKELGREITAIGIAFYSSKSYKPITLSG